MKSCAYIKERIDEADKPGLLSFEVTEHLGKCADCQRFANERTALRMLVASGRRVNAPVNFNAVLNSRLAEVKARRTFWWLGSPNALRLGAATAGVALVLVVAQFTGLLTNHSIPADRQQTKELGSTSPQLIPPNPPHIETVPIPMPSNETVATGRRYAATSPNRRRTEVASSSVVPVGDFSSEDGGVVLVRGQNGDLDVQMPTVSVGAQPLMYARSGQRAVRNVGTSF